jgi:basic membrane protein A and related proteins
MARPRVYGRPISRWIALAAVAAAATFAVAGANAAAGSKRQVRIGLVLEQPVVRRKDDPFQYGAYQGLVNAHKRLQIQAKAVSARPIPADQYDASPDQYVAQSLSQYAAQFSYLATQNYDLVIAVGYLELPALSQATHRFPREKFGVLDATRENVHLATPKGVRPRLTNVEGTVFHTEQAAYLAGFLAARMADRTPHHVVSVVGGLQIPPVETYIAGFDSGAKAADRNIRLLHAYSGDFLNKEKCAHAARFQIDTEHSQVVFDVAGACGIGALQVAIDRHVYGIGVDIDQSYLSRKFILTSVLKNLNLAVTRLVDGRLHTGGDLIFDLRNGGVGLGRFSTEVPLAFRHQLARLAARIEQGKIPVPTTLSRSH